MRRSRVLGPTPLHLSPKQPSKGVRAHMRTQRPAGEAQDESRRRLSSNSDTAHADRGPPVSSIAGLQGGSWGRPGVSSTWEIASPFASFRFKLCFVRKRVRESSLLLHFCNTNFPSLELGETTFVGLLRAAGGSCAASVGPRSPARPVVPGLWSSACGGCRTRG